MSERDDAIKLANKVLDTPGHDPDDDLSMMSRQFLRAIESIWRPIETAPKVPAQTVDLWLRSGERVTDCRWSQGRDRWEHWGLGGFDRMEMIAVDGDPTHWAELTNGPEAEQ